MQVIDNQKESKQPPWGLGVLQRNNVLLVVKIFYFLVYFGLYGSFRFAALSLHYVRRVFHSSTPSGALINRCRFSVLVAMGACPLYPTDGANAVTNFCLFSSRSLLTSPMRCYIETPAILTLKICRLQ